MAAASTIDIREMILGNGPFGPAEVRSMIASLGHDADSYRELRAAVVELERSPDRSPAASVRLGVCQELLGRYAQALDTLRSGDGGALSIFHQGRAHAAMGSHDKAIESFTAARRAGYDAAACVAAAIESLRAAGRLDEARREAESFTDGAKSAEFEAAKAGVLADSGAPPAEIATAYEKALAIDPGHSGALFALGVLHDRMGNDDEAKNCYERSLERYPPTLGSLLNLGIMHEDRDEFVEAQRCYRRILEAIPDHPRARLFLRDSIASSDLQVGEQDLRQRGQLDQVLALPVSDFELSVRSRNCLQKMGINTLGDLARTTEEEILASKNFGETSLVEIKDMLASKGLSLGQLAESMPLTAEVEVEAEAPSSDDQEIYGLPIAELNLSVRARKCTTKLGITTIGDLVRRTADDLLECKNFGVTSLNEVRERLAERGLRLRGD